MRTTILLLFAIILIGTGCKTSKPGCEAANGSGPKFKASKGFDWYKGK